MNIQTIHTLMYSPEGGHLLVAHLPIVLQTNQQAFIAGPGCSAPAVPLLIHDSEPDLRAALTDLRGFLRDRDFHTHPDAWAVLWHPTHDGLHHQPLDQYLLQCREAWLNCLPPSAYIPVDIVPTSEHARETIRILKRHIKDNRPARNPHTSQPLEQEPTP